MFARLHALERNRRVTALLMPVSLSDRSSGPKADLGHFGKLAFLCTAAVGALLFGSRLSAARTQYSGALAKPYTQKTISFGR